MDAEKIEPTDEEHAEVEPTDAYEAPTVEDLDTSHGTAVTPAGTVGSGLTGAAPRDLS